MKDICNDMNPLQPDDFDQLLRDKLDGHQVTAPKDSWNAIASVISGPAPKSKPQDSPSRRVQMYWISGVAAASVALLFGLFALTDLFTSDISVSSDQFGSAVSVSSLKDENPVSEDNQIISNDVQLSDNQLDKPSSYLAEKEKKTSVGRDKIISENIHQNQSDTSKSIQLNDLNTINSSGSTNHHDDISTDISKSDENPSGELKDNQLKKNDLWNDDELIASWEDPIKKQNKQDWSLSAGVGMNSGVPDMGASDFLDMVLSDKFATSSELYSYVPSPNEFRNRNYHLPLSFGVLLSKKIGHTMYLESGLVYTFLQTSYTDLGWGNWKADQKLHYLGLPLNLKVDLWSAKKWSVYLTGGMMFEKGLWSVYEQHQYWNNADQMVLVEKKINGWQYSLNGSTGFAYRLYKQTDLYVEPQISYFFDQGQPLSIRTEMPLSIGVKAGLRFGLK